MSDFFVKNLIYYLQKHGQKFTADTLISILIKAWKFEMKIARGVSCNYSCKAN